jgi:hypothetical protein
MFTFASEVVTHFTCSFHRFHLLLTRHGCRRYSFLRHELHILPARFRLDYGDIEHSLSLFTLYPSSPHPSIRSGGLIGRPYLLSRLADNPHSVPFCPGYH